MDLISRTLRRGDLPADIDGQQLELDEDDIEYLVYGLRECNLLQAVLIATRGRSIDDEMTTTSTLNAFQWDQILFTLCEGDSSADTSP